jgi:hypothetical protein
MIRKKTKRNNKLLFVRYTLLGLFLTGVFFLISSTGEAKEDAFEGLVTSIRDPFIIKEKVIPLPQIKEPEPIIVPEPVIIVEPEPIKVEPPKVIVRPQLPEMNVTGLVFKTKHPQAIINGQVVGIGDTINEAKVLKIKEGGLFVRYQSNIFFIKYSNK